MRMSMSTRKSTSRSEITGTGKIPLEGLTPLGKHLGLVGVDVRWGHLLWGKRVQTGRVTATAPRILLEITRARRASRDGSTEDAESRRATMGCRR